MSEKSDLVVTYHASRRLINTWDTLGCQTTRFRGFVKYFGDTIGRVMNLDPNESIEGFLKVHESFMDDLDWQMNYLRFISMELELAIKKL